MTSFKWMERLPDEGLTIYKLGNSEYGIVPDCEPQKMERWFDHQFDGSGADNTILEAFGKELDLEFCSSMPFLEGMAIARENALASVQERADQEGWEQ